MVRKRLQCTLCAEKFVWEHEGFPDECPKCGQYIGNDGKPEVAAPHIALRIGKVADNVYRQMEKGAETRQEHAAEFLGVPKSELSDMKITNMRDDNVIGESSAPKLSKGQNEIMDWFKGQAAQPQVSSTVAPQSYNTGRVFAETLRRDPKAHAELGHPRSGAGAGVRTLGELKNSRYAR